MKKFRKLSLIVAVAVAALCIADAALAAAPFQQAPSTFVTDMTAWLTPFGAIGLIAVAVIAAFGIIHWMWAAGIFFFVLTLFGHDQIITWFRSLAGI